MFSQQVARQVTIAAAAIALVSQLSVAPAFADDADKDAPASTVATPLRMAALTEASVVAPVTAPVKPFESRGGSGLVAIYVATAALQVLDAHSTMTAIGSGAREANPFMKGIASNKVALLGVKAAVASSTIFIVRKLARRNRLGAIVTGIAVNSAYAAVVAHNYRVANRMK